MRRAHHLLGVLAVSAVLAAAAGAGAAGDATPAKSAVVPKKTAAPKVDAGASPVATATPKPKPTPTPKKEEWEADLPGHSSEYLRLLDTLLTEMWPDLTLKSMFAAQIEQETCISRKSKGCWNPRTELKTSREYGFGLGQITIIYNEDGTVKSSTFEDLKKLGGKLASWKFEDRYDPEMQLRGMILMEKLQYHKIQFDVADDTERMAFMLSAYNGGIGGILQDRRLCEKPDCDNSKWFGNVAINSKKAKKPISGYATSFYDTNRCYPRFILMDRRPVYAGFMTGTIDHLVEPTARMPNKIDGSECAKSLGENGLGKFEVPAKDLKSLPPPAPAASPATEVPHS